MKKVHRPPSLCPLPRHPFSSSRPPPAVLGCSVCVLVVITGALFCVTGGGAEGEAGVA
jgi:hypothetical protein